MATSYGALCSDFYVNQKLAMRLDLPEDRETVLHLFDRMRKSEPSMSRFRRYDGEFVLEGTRRDVDYRWMSLWRNAIRSGHVNPDSMESSYKLHRHILEQVPYYLTISPIDIDYLELTFGFDLECNGNHDEVVADALFTDSSIGELMRMDQTKVLDVQPMFSIGLSKEGDLQACFEVKTRRKNRRGNASRFREEPLSILLSVRKYGPFDEVSELPKLFEKLTNTAETLTTDRLVPNLLLPISRQITSSNA